MGSTSHHCQLFLLSLNTFTEKSGFCCSKLAQRHVVGSYIELIFQDTIETEPRSMNVEQMFDTINGFVNLFMNIRTLKHYERIWCTDRLTPIRVNSGKVVF